MAELTPSQTVGPFFAYCLTPEEYTLKPVFSGDLVVPGLAGDIVRIEGVVTDGDGAVVPDAVVEIWQADASGSFAHGVGSGTRSNTGFRGFGRSGTNKEGHFGFRTVKPGRVKDAKGTLQAPHLDVTILARGMLKQVVTRIYFGDEAANASDPVLALVPEDRRTTLIALPGANGSGETLYRFDIRLQESDDGVPETVFFDV
jgi:protocatechuate 3,4-dioxygenase alpha subunit